jgi:hypothetical protein
MKPGGFKLWVNWIGQLVQPLTVGQCAASMSTSPEASPNTFLHASLMSGLVFIL